MSVRSSLPPRRVRALPEALANQIAAGEVVERPASVLKELLENSLDAGAHSVHVDVEGGGARLIRVRDDGCGIVAGDLVLALARHATSKIATLEELERVATLGFRGEALPSIASVSRLSLSSRPVDAGSALRVQVHGGGPVIGPEPSAHPVGTTVEVRDLFYNTPARRRFLRTERTEFGHLEEALRRIALGRGDVAFRLSHNGKTTLSLPVAPGRDAVRRIARLCGGEFLDGALEIEYAAAGLALCGWVLPPSRARTRSDLQYFFVNRRIVRDRVVSHALRQAYGHELEPGRHPGYVLYFTIDPEQVDVNVHPTKHEVRFREVRLVHDFLVRSLLGAWRGERMADQAASSPSAPDRASTARVREAMAGYAALRGPREQPTVQGGPRLLCLVGDCAIAEVADGLLLVDAPALLELVFRHRLESVLASDSGPVSQPVLVPVAVTVDEAHGDHLEGLGPALARVGLDLRRSGPRAVALRQLPAALREVDPGRFAPTLCAALGDLAVDAGPEVLARALAREGARAALERLRAGGGLDAFLAEAEALSALARRGVVRRVEADDLMRWTREGAGVR